MIQKSEIIPLILSRCPTFVPSWEKHRKCWGTKEPGIYNDLGEFAQFVVTAYSREDKESVVAAFEVIEELLGNGDEEIRTAAAIGFLEDVQVIASNRPFGAGVFVQWLGPKSTEVWAEIKEIWRGKNSLTDVVREEQAAKKKSKS